jgi:hypothetical protein
MPDPNPPAPKIQRFDPTAGDWVDAEPVPFHYGALARLARLITRGRWPR